MGTHRKARPRPLRKTPVEPAAVDNEPVLPTSRRRRARTARADDVVRRIDETLRETDGQDR